MRYIRNHYQTTRTIVVFGGYENRTTTKCIEQMRRSVTKSSADIELMLDAITTTTQSEFLTNPYNKSQLLRELTEILHANNIKVHQAQADADVEIAGTTLNS